MKIDQNRLRQLKGWDYFLDVSLSCRPCFRFFCSLVFKCGLSLQSGLKNLREHVLMELMVVSVHIYTQTAVSRVSVVGHVTSVCADAHGGAVLRLPQDEGDSGVSVGPLC